MSDTVLGNTEGYLSFLEDEVDRYGCVAVGVEMIHRDLEIEVASLLSRFSVTAHGNETEAYYILRARPETPNRLITFDSESDFSVRPSPTHE